MTEAAPRRNGNSEIVKWVAFALAGIVLGQFVPLLKSDAASSAEIKSLQLSVANAASGAEVSALQRAIEQNSAAIRELTRSNAELREKIGSEAEKTRNLLEKQITRHEDSVAHEGAARMLLEHAKVLERLQAQQSGDARKPPG